MVGRSVAALVIAAGLAFLTACGGQTSSLPSGAAAAECVDATNIAANGIMKGATGDGMKFISAKAVKSPDFSKVYFIAMKFSATGIEDQVGVWASNSLEPGGGLIIAVDGVAQQFSDWGPGSSTAAEISPTDPSVAVAKACLV